MRGFHIELSGGETPVYLQIAQGLRQAIQDGRLKPGEKTPSTRQLSQSLKVHRNTILSALNELLAEGWLVSEERKAYRVSAELPLKYFGVTKTDQIQHKTHVTSFQWDLAREVKLEQLRPTTPVKYAFRWGFPDLSKFPHKEFRSHVLDVLRRPKPLLFDYGSPRGYPSLVEALEAYLRRLRGITNRSVFVMHGAGEGMALLSHLLLKPGDVVAMEDPGYSLMREWFRLMGAKVVFIPVENDGLDVDALEKILKRQRVKLLFLTPLHQFPTTVTLAVPKRLRLYELASKYGMGIMEDDYDHEFHYKAQPLPPLVSQDPEERVLYAGTFSKVLFPAARIGFVVVPKSLETQLMQLRRMSTHQNDAIMQDAMARWMLAGGLERHLRRMRRHYESQRNLLVEELEKVRGGGRHLEWRVPDGGMALWLNTFIDSRKFAEQALARGIFVSPEWLYRVCAGSATHVRLGYSSPTSAEMREGIAHLTTLFSK